MRSSAFSLCTSGASATWLTAHLLEELTHGHAREVVALVRARVVRIVLLHVPAQYKQYRFRGKPGQLAPRQQQHRSQGACGAGTLTKLTRRTACRAVGQGREHETEWQSRAQERPAMSSRTFLARRFSNSPMSGDFSASMSLAGTCMACLLAHARPAADAPDMLMLEGSYLVDLALGEHKGPVHCLHSVTVACNSRRISSPPPLALIPSPLSYPPPSTTP